MVVLVSCKLNDIIDVEICGDEWVGVDWGKVLVNIGWCSGF